MEDACFQKVFNEYKENINELLALNTKILDQKNKIFEKCHEKQPGQFCITIVKKMNLKNGLLWFNSESEEIKNCKYSDYFTKLVNVFNDALPTDNYFDLTSAIEKLQLLNPLNEKVKNIVSEWNNQLGNLNGFLQNLEEEIQKKLNKTLFIQKEMNLSCSNKYKISKKREVLENFEFRLILNEETK